MRKIVFVLTLAFIVVSCGTRTRVKIHLKVKGAPKGTMIVLQEIKVNTAYPVDSSATGKSGKMDFTVTKKEPGFYQLTFPNHQWITLLADPGERIKVEVHYDSLPFGYSVSGSPGSRYVKELGETLYTTVRKMDSLRTLYAAIAANPAENAARDRLEKEYIALADSQHLRNVKFILSHYNSLASIYALYQKYDDSTWVFHSSRDLQFFKIVGDSLSKRYPRSNEVKALRTHFYQLMKVRESLVLQSLARGKSVGYPDLYLPNAKMDSIRLSSLQGKVILLSFFLSAVPACLMQNREYMEIYKRYRNRGFEIYQVSLDPDMSKWVSFTAGANYPWISVWDGPFENSMAARLYNVQRIPAEYIISKQGEIMAVNPDADQLEKLIAELLR